MYDKCFHTLLRGLSCFREESATKDHPPTVPLERVLASDRDTSDCSGLYLCVTPCHSWEGRVRTQTKNMGANSSGSLQNPAKDWRGRLVSMLVRCRPSPCPSVRVDVLRIRSSCQHFVPDRSHRSGCFVNCKLRVPTVYGVSRTPVTQSSLNFLEYFAHISTYTVQPLRSHGWQDGSAG